MDPKIISGVFLERVSKLHMAKRSAFEGDNRKKLVEGINSVANAVKTTLGSKGAPENQLETAKGMAIRAQEVVEVASKVAVAKAVEIRENYDMNNATNTLMATIGATPALVESALVKVLYYARNEYIRKGLVGSICFTFSILAMGSSVQCDVSEASMEDAEATAEGKAPEENEMFETLGKLALLFRNVLPGVDGAIQRMSLRSRDLKNCKFIDEISMSDSTTLADPSGVTGLSITLQLSASAKSLVVYDQGSK